MRKWIYVERKDGSLLAKDYLEPEKAFKVLASVFKVVSTVSRSDHQVIYRVYN